MALKDENILGLVEKISDSLDKMLFMGLGTNAKDYENFEECVELKKNVKKEIENKNFGIGEKLIFDEIEKKIKNNEDKNGILRVGCWFYLKLNSLDEETLKQGNFSKENIYHGIKKIEDYFMGVC